MTSIARQGNVARLAVMAFMVTGAASVAGAAYVATHGNRANGSSNLSERLNDSGARVPESASTQEAVSTTWMFVETKKTFEFTSKPTVAPATWMFRTTGQKPNSVPTVAVASETTWMF